MSATYTTIHAAVLTVTADVGAGLDAIQTALRGGTSTTADLRRTLAVLTAAAADIRLIRVDLDTYSAEAQQLYTDAAVTLALWRWLSGARWALAGLDSGIRKGIAIANELIQGRPQTRHAVRLGDTLQSIAARYLGSWKEWEKLVDANGLDPGAALLPGAILTIPARV